MVCAIANEKQMVQEAFERDGYYLAKDVYNPKQIAELEVSFDRIVEQLERSAENINAVWPGEASELLQKQFAKTKPHQIIHTHNVHRYDPIWMRAFMDPKFLELAVSILGEDIILHHSKLFMKPAQLGGAFPIHQDYSYFSTEKDSMIAGVIHLSDGNNSMGGLRLYPGSHKLGRLDGTDGRILNQRLMNEFPIEKSVSLDIEAGDVLFFHYFTLHGSLPNLSDTPRKTVLVQMYNGYDQIENSNGHIDERIALHGWNHRMSRKRAE